MYSRSNIYLCLIFILSLFLLACNNNIGDTQVSPSTKVNITKLTNSSVNSAVDDSQYGSSIAFITADGTVFSCLQSPQTKALVKCANAIVGINPFQSSYDISIEDNSAYILDKDANNVGQCQVNGRSLINCQMFVNNMGVKLQSLKVFNGRLLLTAQGSNTIWGFALSAGNVLSQESASIGTTDANQPFNLAFQDNGNNESDTPYLYYTSMDSNVYFCIYGVGTCDSSTGYNSSQFGTPFGIAFYNVKSASMAYITASGKVVACKVSIFHQLINCNFEGTGGNPVSSGSSLSIVVNNGYVYFTNNASSGNAAYYCQINEESGSIGTCQATAYTTTTANPRLRFSYGIAFAKYIPVAYIVSNNTVYSCIIKSDGNFTECSNNRFNNNNVKALISIDFDRGRAFITDVQSGYVWSCPTDYLNIGNCIVANPTTFFTGSHKTDSSGHYYFMNPLYIRINRLTHIANITSNSYIYTCSINANGVFSGCNPSLSQYNAQGQECGAGGGTWGLTLVGESGIGFTTNNVSAGKCQPSFSPASSIGFCPVESLSTGSCNGVLNGLAYYNVQGVAYKDNYYYLAAEKTQLLVFESGVNTNNITMPYSIITGVNIFNDRLYITDGGAESSILSASLKDLQQPGQNSSVFESSGLIVQATDINFNYSNIDTVDMTPESETTWLYVTDTLSRVQKCLINSSTKQMVVPCSFAFVNNNSPINTTNTAIGANIAPGGTPYLYIEDSENENLFKCASNPIDGVLDGCSIETSNLAIQFMAFYHESGASNTNQYVYYTSPGYITQCEISSTGGAFFDCINFKYSNSSGYTPIAVDNVDNILYIFYPDSKSEPRISSCPLPFSATNESVITSCSTQDIEYGGTPAQCGDGVTDIYGFAFTAASGSHYLSISGTSSGFFGVSKPYVDFLNTDGYGCSTQVYTSSSRSFNGGVVNDPDPNSPGIYFIINSYMVNYFNFAKLQNDSSYIGNSTNIISLDDTTLQAMTAYQNSVQ